MKPLSFQFKEFPEKENLDYSLIEYDEKLNLNVNAKTREPAVNLLELDTVTFTKATEGADTDNEGILSLLDTGTLTLHHGEETDSDADVRDLVVITETATITESSEDVDQDR